jgi:hypothetical protein
MSWVSVLAKSESFDKPKRRGRWFRLPPEKKLAIQSDVLRREQIREELAKYTDRAIAERHGVHKRTVNKLCKKT